MAKEIMGECFLNRSLSKADYVNVIQSGFVLGATYSGDYMNPKQGDSFINGTLFMGMDTITVSDSLDTDYFILMKYKNLSTDDIKYHQ